MQATIDMGSILGKAATAMNSSSVSKQVNTKIDAAMLGKAALEKGNLGNHSVDDAAAMFIQVLRNAIYSSGVSSGVAYYLDDVDCGTPYKLSNGTYQIQIGFTDSDLSRPSLQPSMYGSISNLAALYNNGVDHVMKPVYGEWNGTRVRSKTVIPGAHFMQRAVDDFAGNYAYEYNVIDIELDDIYS